MEKNVRESLAKLAHDVWARWMKYQFSKCETHMTNAGARECFMIPPESAMRWTRQMNTPYEDLPESEKKSDREIADETLAILPRDNSKDTTLIECPNQECKKPVDTGWMCCPHCAHPVGEHLENLKEIKDEVLPNLQKHADGIKDVMEFMLCEEDNIAASVDGYGALKDAFTILHKRSPEGVKKEGLDLVEPP